MDICGLALSLLQHKNSRPLSTCAVSVLPPTMSQYPHPSLSPRQRRQVSLPPTSSSQLPRASTSRRIESPVIPFHPIYAPHQTEEGKPSSPRHAPQLTLGGPHGGHHSALRDRQYVYPAPRRPQSDAPPSHSVSSPSRSVTPVLTLSPFRRRISLKHAISAP